MDRRVTPPWWVTSPTWGPLPPYKQVLRVFFQSPAPGNRIFRRSQSSRNNANYLHEEQIIVSVNLVRATNACQLKECFRYSRKRKKNKNSEKGKSQNKLHA